MFSRAVLSVGVLLVAASAFGQAGIRLPQRDEPGLDPAFARGWLSPSYDPSGLNGTPWRDPLGFAPSQRSRWSYSFGERGSLGMSYLNSARDFDQENRQMSVFGSYWLSPSWSLSAETMSREPGGLLRLQDFRIGVQRRF